jgi:competence protein ComEA
MPERDPRRLAAGALVALILALLAAWYLAHSRPTAAASAGAPVPTISLERQSGGRVVVDVAGAVHRPGVYRLSAGMRVADALQRAGGATRRADLSQINRAAKLEDGRQILVPVRASAAAAATAPAVSGGASPGQAPAQPINLNTATLEQLDTLDGVGPATAQKILDYRTAHGGFGSVDELDQIPGIGEKRLAALRDKVRV